MIRKFSSMAFCTGFALLAMLVMTTSPSATDSKAAMGTSTANTAELPSADEPSGGQCRAPIGGEATRADVRDRAPVERTPSGTRLRELKFSDPVVRVPLSGAGTVVSPEGPSPAGKPGGRWLEGYRPTTPKAQAEYQQWLKEKETESPSLRSQRSPDDVSPYHHNLLNPELSQKAVSVPSGYVVRTNVGLHAKVNVMELSRRATGMPVPSDKPDDGGLVGRSGLTPAEYAQVKEIAENIEETPEAQDANQTPVTRAPSPLIAAFDAIDTTEGPNSLPPDPILAVGPVHVVAVVNSHYEVYDKSGNELTNPVAAISLDAFFSEFAPTACVGIFDPWIDYDEENDRFVLGMDDVAGADAYFCIAASETGDPLGNWNVYAFQADAMVPNLFADFPHMGIGLEAVYISANMFVDGGNYSETRLWAVSKTDLYNGAASLTIAESAIGAPFTVQPVKLHGFLSGGWPAPGTPHYFIQHSGGVPLANLNLWRWSNPFGQGPAFWNSVTVNNIGGPPDAPEMGSPNFKSTGGDLPDAEYRGGFVYTARTTGCNIGGGSSESCIDWAKVDVTGGAPVLAESQTGAAFGTADEYRYYPDISVDRAGNIAIGYTKSSTSLFTQIHVTGRESGDPVGNLQVETLQAASTGAYSDGTCGPTCDRWGDYTGMSVDPDGCTFWYIGEYSGGGGPGNWVTNIGSYKFPSCSVDSLVALNKSTFSCSETVTVTVDDSIALTEVEVSAQTAVTTSNGDSETISVGNWTGSGCTGNACTQWTVQLSTSDTAVAINDGKIDVANGGTISVDYVDPHGTHASQSRTVQVDCQTRFDDGGFLIDGGCENGGGAELYRDYIDAGELVAYTAGFFNPPSAQALTDVVASLSISGPAAGLITVFNPTVNVGPVGQGQLGGAVFYLSVDPGVDTAALRLSPHDFNISLTSAADGYIAPQVLVQQQLVQADDNIVNLSECFNFESGPQGFQAERFVDATVNTVQAPWTFGSGCGSETRIDQTDSTCDAGGTSAWMSNANAFSCTNFAQAANDTMDDILYSPIFAPANTGNAVNGQPWSWSWLTAEWFYRSQDDGAGNPTVRWGHFWSDDYQGIDNPAQNEINTAYQWSVTYPTYMDQDWDSATPWDPINRPANYDAVSFPTSASGEAIGGLQWRWAHETFDIDFGGDPNATPSSLGLAIDNMQLFYDEYHAEEQIGVCSGATGTVSFDQFQYLECPGADLGIAVLDGDAGGSVTVTVTSDGTGDSETITIVGAGPNYEDSLPYSTSDGGGINDGTLYVTPADVIRISYDDSNPVDTATNAAFVACPGGEVVLEGVVGLQDDGTGDGDGNADQNEIVDLSLQIRNDTTNDLTNVRAVISSNDSTVQCILKASADFGTITGNGGTASNNLAADPFTFVVADSAQCTDPGAAPTATFNVFITADGLSGAEAPQSFTLRMDLNDLGSTLVLDENFDGTQPAGWTHQVGPGDEDGNVLTNPPIAGSLPCGPFGDNWFWRNSGGNTGGAFFCWNNFLDNFPNGTYDDMLDAELISPIINIPAGGTSATLTFDHEFRFGSTADFILDGVVVYYRVNAGAWQKITALPYGGPLIWNTYCNPLCNGGASLFDAEPPATNACFTENVGVGVDNGENVFAFFNSGIQNWTTVQATVTGLTSNDQVEFRWRLGSMNTGALGIATTGGYGLDNVQVLASEQACDTLLRPEVGCSVTFESAGNLTQLCGDSDASVEPGEQWSIDVSLVNETATSAVNTVADLAVDLGGVQAVVAGNPGSYGTLAPGASSTANHSFIVDSGAICVDDVDFNLTGIMDNATVHDNVLNAFAVQIGNVAGAEVGFQGTDPLESLGPVASSILSPIFSLSSADTGSLSYDFVGVPVLGSEVATQDTTPLNINNGVLSSTLSPAFAISGGSATAATVNWTSLTGNNVNRCTQIVLFAPGGASTTLKALLTNDLSPYDVTPFYQTHGPGQYSIEVTDDGTGPCGSGAGFSELAGTSLTVDGLVAGGDWDLNARVSLWDGTTATVLKGFGQADANPYDVSPLYTGSAQYEVRVEAQNGEGFRVSNAVMSITQTACDVSSCVAGNLAPPLGDDVVGSGIRLNKGVGAGDVDITFDNATCSDDHAVVVYGNLGNFTGYQGAVDFGCNLGSTGSATFNHANANVWFNVLWVTSDNKAGHPGYDSGSLIRPWNALGLCGAVSDDQSDPVCN